MIARESEKFLLSRRLGLRIRRLSLGRATLVASEECFQSVIIQTPVYAQHCCDLPQETYTDSSIITPLRPKPAPTISLASAYETSVSKRSRPSFRYSRNRAMFRASSQTPVNLPECAGTYCRTRMPSVCSCPSYSRCGDPWSLLARSQRGLPHHSKALSLWPDD